MIWKTTISNKYSIIRNMETGDSLKPQDRPAENLPGIITTEAVRSLLQNTFDLPNYDRSKGLGINLPYIQTYSENFPDRTQINSFGVTSEIKAYPLLSGIGILRDVLSVQNTDIDGDRAALITIDLDGSNSHLIPLVIVLKDNIKLSGRQGLGTEIDNSKKPFGKEWIMQNEDYIFFHTPLYDFDRIHPKQNPYDYFDYLRRAPSKDSGKVNSVIQLLNIQKNSPIGFSFDPAKDHHFCDYMPWDDPIQFFKYGTFVQGIHAPEAIWIDKTNSK